MKKYKYLLVILLVCTLFVAGCGKEQEKVVEEKPQKVDSETVYLDVLNSERSYQEYSMKGEDNLVEQGSTKVSDYYDKLGTSNSFRFAFVDLDQDKEKELVLELNEEVLVLKYVEEQEKVNGFIFDYRAMSQIHKNGVYQGSGGAAITTIYQLHFEDGMLIEEEIASTSDGKYYVDGEEVNSSEYETELAQSFTSSPEVSWQLYDISTPVTKENLGNGFQVGNVNLPFGSYYLELADGTLATDGTGTITISEDGICNYVDGMANMECLSYYAGNLDDNAMLCLKLAGSQDSCFEASENKLSGNFGTYIHKSVD